MTCCSKTLAYFVVILIFSINTVWAETTGNQEQPVSPTANSTDTIEPKNIQPEKPLDMETEIDKFINQLLDDNPLVVEEARNELLEIGKRAVPSLIKTLGNEKYKLRYLVCEILVELRDERTLPEFIKLLTDKEEIGNSIASLAAKGLGKLGSSTAITPLISSWPTPDIELRYEIINSLGVLRAEEAIPIFLSALTDTAKTYSDYLVRCVAIESTGKLKAKDAVRQLINMLSDTEIEPATDFPVLHYIIKALEKITDISFGSVLFNDKKKEKEIIDQWLDWWEKNKGDYGETVTPPEETPKPPEPLPEQPPADDNNKHEQENTEQPKKE